MRWALHTAPLYRAAIKSGHDATSFEPPFLSPELSCIYDDFWELSTERQIGFAPGQIPASSIAAQTVGWPEDEAEMFRFCIRAMDKVYLEKPDQSDTDETSDNPARDAFRGSGNRKGSS